MKLSDLLAGQKGIIVHVRGDGAFRRRILEMGFVRGEEVETMQAAPLKDPTEYKVMGYEVSLRRSEADLIDVVPLTRHLERKMQRLQQFRDFVGAGSARPSRPSNTTPPPQSAQKPSTSRW
jgi:ferrous iron transport protein B